MACGDLGRPKALNGYTGGLYFFMELNVKTYQYRVGPSLHSYPTLGHRSAKTLSTVAGVLLLASVVAGQAVGGTIGVRSSLGSLPRERRGTAMHAGSWDRSGRNADYRSIAPGKTLVLLNYHGSGIIRHFWCTFPGNTTVRCQLILRMYWTEKNIPACVCPWGPFSP